MRYSMELLTTVNKRTNKQTHFKQVCGVWRRIAKADQQKAFREKEGACNMSTTGYYDDKSPVIRHRTTLIFNFPQLGA